MTIEQEIESLKRWIACLQEQLRELEESAEWEGEHGDD